MKRLVEALTAVYEAKFSEPWLPKYSLSMLGAILGVEISISEVQCKYKLSQNRYAVDRKQLIEQLQASGSTKLAESMHQYALLHDG